VSKVDGCKFVALGCRVLPKLTLLACSVVPGEAAWLLHLHCTRMMNLGSVQMSVVARSAPTQGGAQTETVLQGPLQLCRGVRPFFHPYACCICWSLLLAGPGRLAKFA
jgi:hypothetical protein